MANTELKFLRKYGTWALVTGASDGIGRELARGCAAAGLNVVLVARRAHRLQELATEFEKDHGIQTRCLAVDLEEASAVGELFELTRDLDIGLAALAAGFGSAGPFHESDLANELAMLSVNCRAVVELSHWMSRRFVQRGSGALILLSSLVAFQGVPGAANYAATKAYIQSFAEGLAAELAPHGVDVLAAAPGPVLSGFAARAHMHMGATDSAARVAKGTLLALGKRTVTRPGLVSKCLGWSLTLLPRWLRVRVLSVVMSGMIKPRVLAA